MSNRHTARAATAHPISARATTTTKRPARPRWLPLAAAAGAALAAALPAPAIAQPAAPEHTTVAAYPPPTCFAQVSSTTVPAGGQLTVSGDCYRPGSQVTIKLDTTVLARVIADSSGVATATVTIPPGTPPGTYKISLTGVKSSGVPLVETAQIQVVSGLRTAHPSGQGGTATPLAVGGSAAAAVVAGGGGLVLRRRRGHHR